MPEDRFRTAFFAALAASGRTLRSVCIAAGVSYDQMKKVKQGRSKTTNSDDAARLAAELGYKYHDLLQMFAPSAPTAESVSVAGRVGAGAEVVLVDDHARGDGLYHVARPSDVTARPLVAVEVVGDSMRPHYPPGTVLFYRRDAIGVPTEALRRICVCEDDAGQVWIKEIRVGTAEGTFSLISSNPDSETRHAVRLKWAAPVLHSLLPEFVTRLD